MSSVISVRTRYTESLRVPGQRQSPEVTSVTPGTSARKGTEVTAPYAAQKSLSPDSALPVPQTDTGRQGDFPQGERANLC
ncbi:MAG: hypothetical protein NVSMB54_37880 [Ktedonobacteraceae bacterium]